MENEIFDLNNNEPEELSLENFERAIKEKEDSYREYVEKKEKAESAAKSMSFIFTLLGAIGNSMGGTSSSGSTNNPNSFVGDIKEYSMEEWVELSPEERDMVIQFYESRGESLAKWKIAMIVIAVVIVLVFFIFVVTR